MAHSTVASLPKKPRPDFPLYPHRSGRWAKKVRRVTHYFGGMGDDPNGQKALKRWLDQKDDLLAGRTPRASAEGLTIGELCDRFLQAKDKKLAADEIAATTWRDYKKTCDRLVAEFGKRRFVTDLVASDFESLRESIAKHWGPVALGNEIQRVRMVFRFARVNKLILEEVTYGSEFKRPNRKVLRLARKAKGPKMLEPDQIRKLIDKAGTHMRAAIYLAINCGFGNNDVGTLPRSALDLQGGWVNYHRPKTGIDRRCPLWPETVTAVKASLAKRPKPKSPEVEPLVFVTKYGGSWAGSAVHNPVCAEFRKLLDELKMHRDGLGFYALRHVFQTIGDESRATYAKVEVVLCKPVGRSKFRDPDQLPRWDSNLRPSG